MTLETLHVLQHQKGKCDKGAKRQKILKTLNKYIGPRDIELFHGNNYELVGCDAVLLWR
jgi:hypothetical protein